MFELISNARRGRCAFLGFNGLLVLLLLPAPRAAGQCTYEVMPPTASVGVAGMTQFTPVTVTTQGGCMWTAQTSDTWIELLNAGPYTGPLPAQFLYFVGPNPGPARVGIVNIGSSAFTITQAGSCSYLLAPDSATIPALGGSGYSFQIETPSGCAWTAAPSADSWWITVTGGSSGSGPGTVTFSVQTNSGAARSGTIAVAGRVFTVNQAAASCSYSLDPTSASIGVGGASQQMFAVQTVEGCAWSAVSTAAWIFVTGGSTGNGPGSVFYFVEPNTGAARSGTITAGGQTFTVNQAGTCAYLLEPSSADVSNSGASGLQFAVVTGQGCPWTVTSNETWIPITGGFSGDGPGVVTFSVAANPGPSRTGTITAGGQTFTVHQGGSCTYTLEPASMSVPAGGGTGLTFAVITADGCAWTAVSNVNWIVVTLGSSGTGTGAVVFNVAASTGAARTGTITAGGQTFTVTQGAACGFGVVPSEASFTAEGASGMSLLVQTDMGCEWTASPSASWIVLTGASSGTGPGTVDYSVLANPGRSARSGTIRVATVDFLVNQAGVACPVIEISPAVLPSAELGKAYSVTFTASGGTSPYQWSLQGNLPAGLSFSAGTLSGTPSAAGSFSFVVGATDGGGCPGQKSYSLTVTSCQKPEPPSITSLPAAVSAGSPITAGWTATVDVASGGSYEVEVSTKDSCADPERLSTRNTWITVPTPAGEATVACFRVRAISATGCEGGFSAAAKVNVRVPPALFTVLTAVPVLSVVKGAAAPADFEVVLRNTGGSPGSLALSTSGILAGATPFQFNGVAPGQDVTTRLTFGSDVTASAGQMTGVLTGTWDGGSVSSVVTLSVFEVGPADSRGSQLRYAGTNEITFRHTGAGNPPSQRVKIQNAGTDPVRLGTKIGPGGAWLSVGGDFVSPLAPGETREFEVSVDRSHRTASDGTPPLLTGLLFVNVDGNPEDSAYGQVIDEESPAPADGRGRTLLGANQFSLVLGSAVSAGGLGETLFLSDGWLRNQGGSAVEAELYFTPAGADGLSGEAVKKSTLRLEPYATYRLSNLVNGLFGVDGQSGQVEIRSSQLAQLTVRSTVDSISQKEGALARYGAEIPLAVSGQGAKKGNSSSGLLASQPDVVVVAGIRDRQAGFRTNLILAETRGREATVSAVLYDAEGKAVGSKTDLYVAPYGKAQINSGDRELFPEGVRFDGGTILVTPVSGSGAVTAIATVLDNASSSFAARLGEVFTQGEATGGLVRKGSPRAANDVAFLPAVARSEAANSSFYTSRVVISNLSRAAVRLNLSYIEDKKFGGRLVTRSVDVPARAEGPRARVFDDVVTELFQITENTAGMIRFEGSLAPLSIASETSTPIDVNDLSKGRAVAAVNPAPGKPEGEPYGVFSTSASEVIGTLASGAAQPVVTHPAIEEGFAFRTNLILAELAGEPAEVRVRLRRPGNGGANLGEKTYSLSRFERLQVNRVVRDILSGNAAADAEWKEVEIQVEATGGTGRVLSMVTRIDNNPVSKRADIFILGGAVGGAPVGFGN